MSAELRKNRSTFIHAPILAEIVARLQAGELALAQYLGGKQVGFPRTVVGLTPSFRRSLPETGCLSQGLSHGSCRFLVLSYSIRKSMPREALPPAESFTVSSAL
jgi:hypothetical protein